VKICFPYKTGNISGGPAAFIRNFYKFSQAKGLDTTWDTKEKADILFILAAASQELCKRKKKEGAKIVLRLDNVYHDTSIDFEEYNRPIKETSELSDFVVFQSHFSKRFIERYFGSIEKPYAIIHNGVDNSFFHYIGERMEFPFKVNLLALSRWHPERRVHEAIRIIKEISDEGMGLIIGGGFKVNDLTISDVKQQEYVKKLDLSYPQIRHFPYKIPFEELPNFFRGADLFLYPSSRDSCPNIVIEALSCGLPVVAEKTGSLPEIVGKGGVIIEPKEDDDLSPRDYTNLEEIPRVNTSAFIEAIEEVLANREYYSKMARKRAEELSYMNMGEQYLSVFNNL